MIFFFFPFLLDNRRRIPPPSKNKVPPFNEKSIFFPPFFFPSFAKGVSFFLSEGGKNPFLFENSPPFSLGDHLPFPPCKSISFTLPVFLSPLSPMVLWLLSDFLKPSSEGFFFFSSYGGISFSSFFFFPPERFWLFFFIITISTFSFFPPPPMPLFPFFRRFLFGLGRDRPAVSPRR